MQQNRYTANLFVFFFVCVFFFVMAWTGEFKFAPVDQIVHLENVLTSESINRRQLHQLLKQCAAFNKHDPESNFELDLRQDFLVDCEMRRISKATNTNTPEDQRALMFHGKQMRQYREQIAFWKQDRKQVIQSTANWISNVATQKKPLFSQVHFIYIFISLCNVFVMMNLFLFVATFIF